MNFHNIIFKREDGLGGFRSTTHFKNGLKLSVSAGMGVYCTPREDLSSINQYLSFEIGVFDSDGEWVTKQFFPDHNDDVVGWLNRDDINDLMNRIANHGKPQKDIPGFEGTLDKLNDLTIFSQSDESLITRHKTKLSSEFSENDIMCSADLDNEWANESE